MNAYEGMFVIDLKEIRKDSSEAEKMIEGLIKKSGGEVAEMERWDERKLAYDIKGRDVGLYLLTYFKGGPDVVRKLTRECQLSTTILRSLCFKIKEIPDLKAIAEEERRAAEEKAAAEAARAAEAKAAADKEGEPASGADAGEPAAGSGTAAPEPGPGGAETERGEREAAPAEPGPESDESEESKKIEEDK